MAPEGPRTCANAASLRATETNLSVHDVLELRRLKKKSVGVDAAALLRGDPLLLRQKAEEEKARRKKEDADPWRLKTGGLVDLGEVKGSKMAFGEEPVSIGGGGFAAASNTMDTEKKMQEFIEQELSKRRQGASDPSTELSASNDTLSTIEDGANGPQLDEAQKPQSEGNVSFSAAMLTSIPVVDLGISTKLDNIEATEKARRDLMEKKKQLKDVDALTGPMNSGASVRFYKNKPHEDRHASDRNAGGDHKSKPDSNAEKGDSGKRKFDRRTMATDDLVMDKFKKRNYPRR
ncbi:hypothetical protein HDU81_010222 [Chytriomyces hyalinus]|nr:hypothetical protein HDU81_010222 [Chytriomyces hyalinus]